VQPQLHPDTVLVLDEVGPLEADGDGFREVLDRVLASRRPAVLTTRPGLVDWLAGLAGEDRVDVVDLTDPGR
jgi:nucleoside-triphosphatase THEP1